MVEAFSYSRFCCMSNKLYSRCWAIVSFIISFKAALWRALAAKALPIQLAASPTAAAMPPTIPPLANPCPILVMEVMASCTPVMASAAPVLPIASNMEAKSPATPPSMDEALEAASSISCKPSEVSLNPLDDFSFANPFVKPSKISSHSLPFPPFNSLSRAFFNLSSSSGLLSMVFNCSAEMKVSPLESPLLERYDWSCLAWSIRFCKSLKAIWEVSPNRFLKKLLSFDVSSASASLTAWTPSLIFCLATLIARSISLALTSVLLDWR